MHTLTAFERGHNAPLSFDPAAIAHYESHGKQDRALQYAETAALQNDPTSAQSAVLAGCIHGEKRHPTLSFYFHDLAARSGNKLGRKYARKQLVEDLNGLLSSKKVSKLYKDTLRGNPDAAYTLAKYSEKAFSSTDGKILLLYAQALTHPNVVHATIALNKVRFILGQLDLPEIGETRHVYEALPDKTHLPTQAVSKIRSLLKQHAPH